MHKPEKDTDWDHSSDERFTSYYEQESATDDTYGRCSRSRDALLRLLASTGYDTSSLEVLDIGCNAGTLSNAWAELGHRVHGIDINEPLLEIAKRRSAQAGFEVDYRLGSAVDLPWGDESMDVAVALELLEHVEDWEAVVNEMMRVVRPGGAMLITTTNRLCPRQSEFTLPMYSWYPGFVKDYCVRLAQTTRPEIANYARYPAFHWFTFYGLRKYGRERGFESFDSFDLADLSNKGALKRTVLELVRKVPPLRFLAHMGRDGTAWAAIKRAPADA